MNFVYVRKENGPLSDPEPILRFKSTSEDEFSDGDPDKIQDEIPKPHTINLDSEDSDLEIIEIKSAPSVSTKTERNNCGSSFCQRQKNHKQQNTKQVHQNKPQKQ